MFAGAAKAPAAALSPKQAQRQRRTCSICASMVWRLACRENSSSASERAWNASRAVLMEETCHALYSTSGIRAAREAARPVRRALDVREILIRTCQQRSPPPRARFGLRFMCCGCYLRRVLLTRRPRGVLGNRLMSRGVRGQGRCIEDAEEGRRASDSGGGADERSHDGAGEHDTPRGELQ